MRKAIENLGTFVSHEKATKLRFNGFMSKWYMFTIQI